MYFAQFINLCVLSYMYNINKMNISGHVHGVLWIDFERLERLLEDCSGNLMFDDVTTSSKSYPFKGLKDIFMKLKNDKSLDDSEIRCLRKFIESFTTVSLCPAEVGPDVVSIVKEVNVHNHSHTCRKYDTKCRFEYPRYPSATTIVAKPVSGTQQEKKKIMQKNNEILHEVKMILQEDNLVDEIMQKYDKVHESKEEYYQNIELRIREVCSRADVSYEDYMKALSISKVGYKIIQRRDIDEVYVNSYNTEMIRAWNGNMDLQICLDFFAVTTYVTDYLMKPVAGPSKEIRQGLKDSGATELKEQMKIVANMFMTHREMGEAEAVYKLIPSMHLRGSNVTCQWVTTCAHEERSCRFRKATDAQLKTGIDAFKIDGHDGLFYEVQDIWSKYLRRPDSLSKICFAQFARMYRSVNFKEEGEDDMNEDDQETEEAQIAEPELGNFKYVMTHDNNDKNELPKIISLKKLRPGEPTKMRRRRHPAALRYHKLHKATDALKYMLSEIMLYKPLSDEVPKESILEMYEESYNGERKVDLVKAQVMPFLEDVTEARFYVDEVMKDIDTEEVEKTLDPHLVPDNEECNEESEEECSTYGHLDPRNIDIPEDPLPAKSIYRSIEIKPIEELRASTRSMDKYQRAVVDMGVKYAKDLVKARRNFSPVPDPPYVMVHGGAGAGKSTVINVLAQWVEKILQKEGNMICLIINRTMQIRFDFHNYYT